MKRLIPFLILNVIVSALTTLLVLNLWDQSHRTNLPPANNTPQVQAATTSQENQPAAPEAQATLPPLDQEVIRVDTVIGAGDLANETVVFLRVGEGDLLMTGWQVQDEDGNSYTFPDLVLNKNGSVRLYSQAGQNSVIELYWGSGQAIWKNGELVSLYDPQGNLRASFRIP
jgi:hypothetical protein